jgi:MYXO-CTERM domain-containing protein
MRKPFATASIVALSFCGSAQALAADLYVDAAAAAGGDGTAGAPLQEVQAGLDLAMPGDTVHVAPGMYGALTTVRAGTEDAPISVVADSPRTAIVEGGGTSGLAYAHDWHRFEGIVFDGGYAQADLIKGDGGNHIELVGVEVRRSGSDCIDLRNSTDILIERSFIHHCVFNDGGVVKDAHGVTGDSVFDLTIRDTEIAMMSGDSVQLSPPREPWGNLVIEGCTLWAAPLDDPDAGLPLDTPMGENAFDSKVGPELDGNGANPRVLIRDTVAHGFVGFIDNQAAFLLKEDVDATVERVTIYDSDLGFRLRGPAVVRVQNAVVHTVDHVLRYEDGITGVVLANTTIGGGIGSELFEDGGGGGWSAPVIENLLVLDVALPAEATAASSMMVGADVFLDADAHNYRLVEGSAPVDAGAALDYVTEDRDGADRPYGDAYDIGAYEWNPDTGGDTGDDGGDASATGVDDSGSAGDDGTAGEGGSATADDGVDDGPTGGMDSVGDEESGSGSAGEDEDDGGCNCKSSREGSRGAALLVLIVFAARARRRGRARGTTRDRTQGAGASGSL